MAEAQEANLQEQVRGWSLDGDVTVLEVVETELPPQFLLRVNGHWAWCSSLDTALELAYQAVRLRAHLPAQWSAPSPQALEELRQCWPQLRKLQAGAWWPEPPSL
jgi:hypothetical protein